jgi:hypothetical protein
MDSQYALYCSKLPGYTGLSALVLALENV